MLSCIIKRMVTTMLRCLLLLSFVGALVALQRSNEEIREYYNFLKKTQEEREMTLDEAMALNPKASPWENSGKFNGDILLRDEEIDEMVAEYAGNYTSARNGLINTRYRWPNGVVIYEIGPGFNQAQVNMIIQAANIFQQRTCTRWVRRSSLNQRDYVFITSRQTGCYAHVGYFQNFGRHTLNLANGCFNLFIVLHEMFHSAGFHHMHQTYNRDDFVRVYLQNVVRGTEHNFNIHNRNLVTMLGLPYEYASNQHYGAWAFSSNGQRTIVARFNDNGQMGQLTHLTGWDIWRLARLYNCPGAWRVQVDPQDANKPYDEEFDRKLKFAAEEEIKEREMMLDMAIAEKKKQEAIENAA